MHTAVRLLLPLLLASAAVGAEPTAPVAQSEPTVSSEPTRLAEPKLPELDLTYKVEWKGIGLGDIAISLKPDAGTDCYRYTSKTDPVGLVRMFYGRPREVSTFCVAGGKIVPKRFEFIKPGDEEGSFTLDFDVAAARVRDGKGVEREIPANAQDRFAMQQAVRLWLLEHLDAGPEEIVEFTMVDNRRVRAYLFAITGRQQVEVPAGRFDTLLVERVDKSSRSVKFWLAAERNYMPVKVEQTKKGATQLRMELK